MGFSDPVVKPSRRRAKRVSIQVVLQLDHGVDPGTINHGKLVDKQARLSDQSVLAPLGILNNYLIVTKVACPQADIPKAGGCC